MGILVPLCCRAAKKKGVNFQPLCPTVKCVELSWELLSVWVKICYVCLGRTRLLRHLSAKLQRYDRACMKCNISSINGWHLDRCNMATLTLGIVFCNVLNLSSRSEGRDCSGLKKKHISKPKLFSSNLLLRDVANEYYF